MALAGVPRNSVSEPPQQQERSNRADQRTVHKINVELASLKSEVTSALRDVTGNFAQLTEELASLRSAFYEHREKLPDCFALQEQNICHHLDKLPAIYFSEAALALTRMTYRGPNIPIAGYNDSRTAEFVLWLNDFERKFAANNWPADRKGLTLAGYLKGHAKLTYHALPEEVKADYKELVKLLKERAANGLRASASKS